MLLTELLVRRVEMKKEVPEEGIVLKHPGSNVTQTRTPLVFLDLVLTFIAVAGRLPGQ